MAIVVTGGAGYIGSHTCIELLNEGYEVIVVDDLRNSKAEALHRIGEVTGRPFQFYRTDVLNEDALEAVFAGHAVEAVIHFAGMKAVGESVLLPLSYYRNNVAGTMALCQVMQRHGVFKLVFSSSATVYGVPGQVPISEGAPLSAINPYGRTKLMAEEILRDLAVSDPRWSIANLRYFNPVGAHKSGRLGEDPSGIPNNLVPYMTQVAVGKLRQLQVFGGDYPTPDGTGIRDYIHVLDLAAGHVKALERVKRFQGAESYNLGTGRGYSVLEMIAAFGRVSGVELPYIITDRRPGDVAVCYADCSKAAAELGWTAERGLEEMLEDTWRWQAQNPDGYRADRIPSILYGITGDERSAAVLQARSG
ncbi:UDP-glucose 4-epimerase GalE [Paenibacillus gansuensis]|uniref:UDP-glucose 4-epimerase n=1 Tax=Paenibacillus gansuensis TaxID=306542 RepID=A0ABW5PGB6_9BACL